MRHRTSAQSGFILAEVMTALAILSLVLLMATEGFLASSRSQTMLSQEDQLGERLRRIADRLGNHLRSAELRSLTGAPASPDTSTMINFRRVTSFDNLGDPIFGPAERFFTETYVDPQGDSHLRLMWQSGIQKTVWAPNLVSVGFSRLGGGLEIRIDASVSTNADPIQATRTFHVALQN